MKKIIFITLALVFLSLTFLAIILPGLPATPFVAGSSFFAMRSNERLDNWIKKQAFYKETVGDFIKERQLFLKVKVRILTVATVMLMFPFFIVDSIIFKMFILMLLSAKYIYFIFLLDTKEA